jgi:glyoxylase-like metal-dependent hydrolase (beta-lactamase superfamily II)
MAELVVPGCTRIGLGAVNAYLVDSGGDELVLVDAGTPLHVGMIVRGIESAGRMIGDVGDIVITHQHIDHAGGLAGLAARTGATVNVHSLDAPEIVAGRPSRSAYGHNLITRIVAPGSKAMKLPPVEIDHEVVDGEVLAGTLGIEVIHTPGHTAGHCAYLWPAHGGVLFVGDAFANWFGRLGPAPLAEDWDQARESARKLSELDFSTVVFGHGSVLRDGAAARLRAFVEDWV